MRQAEIFSRLVIKQGTAHLFIKEPMDVTIKMATKYAQKPLVAMPMGGLGAISWLDEEVFGYSMTFGIADKRSTLG